MQRVALITGAAKRVGRLVAKDLAGRGYQLVVHSNQSFAEAQQLVNELTEQGTRAIAVQAELREPGAIEQMIATSIKEFGQLDALVNCAAIWKSKPLAETSADDVREHFEVNTLGTFLCCQQAGLQMCRQAKGGAIVNFGDWAIERPYVDYAAYFVSKGAIPTLTRTFAIELARLNPRVRVNAILPGPVLLPENMAESERAAVIDATLVKRAGPPESISDAVAFLLENEFITGACLPVDGGRSIFGGNFSR